MKCPYCGEELYKKGVNYNAVLQKLIENRLVSYGHSKEMSPQKYQSYTAIRRILRILVPEWGWNNANQFISESLYNELAKKLDEILPVKKEVTSC